MSPTHPASVACAVSVGKVTWKHARCLPGYFHGDGAGLLKKNMEEQRKLNADVPCSLPFSSFSLSFFPVLLFDLVGFTCPSDSHFAVFFCCFFVAQLRQVMEAMSTRMEKLEIKMEVFPPYSCPSGAPAMRCPSPDLASFLSRPGLNSAAVIVFVVADAG